MTGDDCSQEVNKTNEHDISADHGFTKRHLYQLGFDSASP